MIEILPNWHPIFVHFTIALFGASGLFFLVSAAAPEKAWAKPMQIAAYWNLWLGALFTIATVGAGFHAYYTVAHDAASHVAMTNHQNWALLTSIAWWVLALWGAEMYRRSQKVSTAFLAALMLGLGMLAVTGFKGGELVFRYGLGVQSLPQVKAEQVDHSHDLGSEEDGHNH